MDTRDIDSRTKLAAFVTALRVDIAAHRDRYENVTLDDFLEAFAAWTIDMEGAFRNQHKEMPNQPTWSLLAMMLHAAAIYE